MFDFNLYFNKNKNIIFNNSIKINQPEKDILYQELHRDVLSLIEKINKLDDAKFLNFKIYLIENITKFKFKHIITDNYSPKWFLNEKISFYLAPDEIIKNMWINFKLTRLWINKLEEDGFII